MKSVVLVALTLAVVSAHADDEWVSVGAARSVAPAAQATTVDTSPRAAPSSVSVSNSSDGLLAEMSMQMEQMQQEIASLRGRIEEQDHLIQQMKQEQQERYLDLDRRVAALMSGTPATPSSSVPVSRTPEAAVTPAEAYKNAQSLMYAKKYSEANQAYEAFVQQYPGESLAVNAIYWSGEIYLLQGNLDKALTRFMAVINDHPEHLKVPDAMYKVGYTLDRQGKTAEAKGWMKKVVDQYQGKSDTVVRLAKNYLDSH